MLPPERLCTHCANPRGTVSSFNALRIMPSISLKLKSSNLTTWVLAEWCKAVLKDSRLSVVVFFIAALIAPVPSVLTMDLLVTDVLR
jgi:hypothetical protein